METIHVARIESVLAVRLSRNPTLARVDVRIRANLRLFRIIHVSGSACTSEEVETTTLWHPQIVKPSRRGGGPCSARDSGPNYFTGATYVSQVPEIPACFRHSGPMEVNRHPLNPALSNQ